ncbi:RNA-directed DNA polymerase, eukaryota, reverse transcriptase zinc-binding domain protein [Tanacetum coccineum]
MKSLKSSLNKLGWCKGNLFKRVEFMRCQLQDVLSKIDVDPHNPSLREIEANLVKDFYEAESDEEKFLYQQAKIKWLSGDKNSSYFHKVFKGRSNRSKVFWLMDDSGNIYEEDQIPQLFLKHFKAFLGTSQPVQDIENLLYLTLMIPRPLVLNVSPQNSLKKHGRLLDMMYAKQIKHVLGMLVSSNQSAFTPVRHIQDNIMLTQEIMKAAFTLNVNEDRIGYFKRGRGLRQGDPISPYLFTLVMEVFSLMLQRQIDKEADFQYHFGCKALNLTHVFFADDLLVMCHRDTTSVKVIKNTLDEFSACSGLIPNNSKSTIFFRSLNEEEKNAITLVIPFAIGKLPVRYLGFPLIAKRLGVKECSWRLQLIAVVLELIHVCWPSVFLLLITIIKEINKLLKWFLWTQRDTASGKAKVAWKTICRPKDQDEWQDKFPMITSLSTPCLETDTRDQLVWRDRNENNMEFSVRTANFDLNLQSPIVDWWKLIWYS